MHSYLGRRRPFLQIRAPHMPYYLNGDIYHSPPSSPANNLGTTLSPSHPLPH